MKHAARIAALYRYPVKGLSAEPCQRLTILPEGRVAGDRALAFRFADSAAPESSWSRKQECAVLLNTPALARLDARLDPEARRLRIALDGAVLADERLDDAGRRRLSAAIERYAAGLAINPFEGHPERLPLRLVGDGVTPRYQDNEAGQVTLHGRETLAAVAAAAGDPSLSELRFRSNIAIEGARAWEEHDWFGRRLRIGEVELEVVRHKTRCLATHANPVTGERDRTVMLTLVKAFAQKEPTFAVGMVTRGPGGDIRLGDEVRVI